MSGTQPDPSCEHLDIAAIVIGRNEGDRLKVCLAALAGQVTRIVYVDSGSTDGSVEAAMAAGAQVVELDLSRPFTAARARNAGRGALGKNTPSYLQFLDGDCEIRAGWLTTACAFLSTHQQAAVACGRRRERHPLTSIYNRFCDAEWDTPVGKTHACGGDALMRTSAFDGVDGFRDDLIAGEEPELCLRLRQAGWEVHRLDAEMTWHDAAITQFPQWWKRTQRAGHAFAEGAALHGHLPERHWVRERNRVLAWGVGLPVLSVLGGGLWPPILLLLLAYPAQVGRLALRGDMTDPFTWQSAVFAVLGKFAEAQGALQYYWRRLRHRQARLIEYK